MYFGLECSTRRITKHVYYAELNMFATDNATLTFTSGLPGCVFNYLIKFDVVPTHNMSSISGSVYWSDEAQCIVHSSYRFLMFSVITQALFSIFSDHVATI